MKDSNGAFLRSSNKEETRYLLELAQREDYNVCIFGVGFFGSDFGWDILHNYKIHVDFFCDNNQNYVGKEIRDGVLCESIDVLTSRRQKTICFLFIGILDSIPVYKQLREMGIKYIVTLEAILDLETTLAQFFSFMNHNQIAIYTCIAGDYDELKEPVEVLDNCDYYFISDKKPERSSVYKWVDIHSIVPKEITDNVLRNRYCKMLPHKFLQEYRYSIYIDGNITLRGDITECIPKLGKSRVGVTSRLYTDNIYAEALRKLKDGLWKPDDFLRQVKEYWYQGMPDDYGAFWCNMLVREHNHPICIKLMEEWWNEFIKYTKRDQISFPYVLWKNGYAADDVMTITSIYDEDRCKGTLFESPYWIMSRGHKDQNQHKWRDQARLVGQDNK